jgi:hypothetical protein
MKSNMKLGRKGLMVLAVAAAASPLTANATDRYWVGPNNGLWQLPNNWSPSGAPAAGDAAYLLLNGTSNMTALFNSGTPDSTVHHLQMDGNSIASMSLVQSGSSMPPLKRDKP